jgi:glutamine synthetase
MRHYLAGLLKHASENTFFLAPYVNSYKRFMAGTFAPTKAIWSLDNRTAGYRVVGDGTPNVRVECRVGGSDLNPYLAIAAQIAAGIAGIDNRLELEKEFKGDAYQARRAREIPRTLADAVQALKKSAMLRDAMGSDVVDHYVRAAEWELEDFASKVTDYEVSRGFERA